MPIQISFVNVAAFIRDPHRPPLGTMPIPISFVNVAAFVRDPPRPPLRTMPIPISFVNVAAFRKCSLQESGAIAELPKTDVRI